jgi:hypothetical protein
MAIHLCSGTVAHLSDGPRQSGEAVAEVPGPVCPRQWLLGSPPGTFAASEGTSPIGASGACGSRVSQASDTLPRKFLHGRSSSDIRRGEPAASAGRAQTFWKASEMKVNYRQLKQTASRSTLDLPVYVPLLRPDPGPQPSLLGQIPTPEGGGLASSLRWVTRSIFNDSDKGPSDTHPCDFGPVATVSGIAGAPRGSA